jgi:putative ABC transport system substrate-binding protein
MGIASMRSQSAPARPEADLSQSRRRRLLKAALALSAAPIQSFAQRPAATMPRIGFLGVQTPTAWGPRLDAFRTGLRDLGYVEGKSIAIEYRFAEGQLDRLPGLADELVGLKIDVLVTHSTAGALAAKKATATSRIPVVMTNVGDAIGTGIVASLARPGGNITGDTFFAPELAAKRLEVLAEAMPRARRIAVVANPDSPGTAPQLRAMDATARALDMALVRIDVRSLADLNGAFAAMAETKVDAIVVNEGDTTIIANVRSIAEQAVARRLPSIGFIEYADAGGLFGYGVDFLALYRRAAVFVDKILKGAKPADIPIERPTTFEFAINARTAAALGIAVSAATRLRANRVIE